MKLFETDNNLMTEGSIRKKIIFFAIPVFIGQLFQQLYNTADALIVGNFVGHDALAAVSATGTLIFLLKKAALMFISAAFTAPGFKSLPAIVYLNSGTSGVSSAMSDRRSASKSDHFSKANWLRKVPGAMP